MLTVSAVVVFVLAPVLEQAVIPSVSAAASESIINLFLLKLIFIILFPPHILEYYFIGCF
jgi:hypothetical protein